MRTRRRLWPIVTIALALAALSSPTLAQSEQKAAKTQSKKKSTKSTAKSSESAAPSSQSAQLSQPASPQRSPVVAQQPAMPSSTQLTLLVQQTMAALGQANITGNYSVLHALSSPTFQKLNSPERLAQIFASVRAAVDVTPVILYQPVLSSPPQLNAGGLLRLTGYYTTNPANITFDLAFVVDSGMWRLEAISVGTRPVQSVGLGAPAAQ